MPDTTGKVVWNPATGSDVRCEVWDTLVGSVESYPEQILELIHQHTERGCVWNGNPIASVRTRIDCVWTDVTEQCVPYQLAATS